MKKLVYCFCGWWVGWDISEVCKDNIEVLDEDEGLILGMCVCMCSCVIGFIVSCYFFCFVF